MAEGKQKKVIQQITLDVYLTAPDGNMRKSYGGEVRRLQRLGFREVNRRIGERDRETLSRLPMLRGDDRRPAADGSSLHPVMPR